LNRGENPRGCFPLEKAVLLPILLPNERWQRLWVDILNEWQLRLWCSADRSGLVARHWRAAIWRRNARRLVVCRRMNQWGLDDGAGIDVPWGWNHWQLAGQCRLLVWLWCSDGWLQQR